MSIILKHDNGIGIIDKAYPDQHLVLGLDVVAGNRYRGHGDRLVPDEAGPWLALETYRGPQAPPRPEVLPVGTRVRRGPDWQARWGSHGTGTVVGYSAGGHNRIHFDDGQEDGYHTRWLEVVSLPEARPASAEPRGVTINVRIADSFAGSAEAMARAVKAMSRAFDGVRVPPPPPDPYTAHRVSLVKRSIERTTWLCLEPDYAHPRAALRGRTFVVPTDLDDHLIPDADESMTGRLRP